MQNSIPDHGCLTVDHLQADRSFHRQQADCDPTQMQGYTDILLNSTCIEKLMQARAFGIFC